MPGVSPKWGKKHRPVDTVDRVAWKGRTKTNLFLFSVTIQEE